MRPITAVTVLYRSKGLLDELTETLRSVRPLCEVTVVDGCSEDGTAEAAEAAMPWARHVRMVKNLGFGAANNLALKEVKTPFVLLINPDARLDLDSLSAMAAFLRESPTTAACQPILRLWDWPVASAGAGTSMNAYGEGYDLRYMHYLPVAPQAADIRVPGVTAALSLWRTEALEECGGFDTSFFMYFEDVDMCLRLGSCGWRFHLLPAAFGIHRSGATSRRSRARGWEAASSVLMARRWLGGGRLPASWWLREIRIQLAALRRGGLDTARLGAIRRGGRGRVAPMEMGAELRSLLQSTPMDLPLPRGSWRDALSGGNVMAGPGWMNRKGVIGLAGQWGGMRLPSASGGALRLALSTDSSYLSGVYGCDAEVLGRFALAPGTTELELEVPAGRNRAYIALDRLPDGEGVTVERADFV